MAGEWIVRSLEDCMAALIDYRGKTPAKTSFGIPLITAKVVKGGRIELPDEFITVHDYETWMRRGIPKPGDVVITTEAPLGEVAQLGAERVALAQRLIALRGKAELLDNGFLKFLMQSEDVQDQLYARASGTTVLGIKQSELRKVLLTLPPLSEQRAIAHILGTLDDKIELNRRMNETLEAMARALFKSWFEDCDPVRVKAADQIRKRVLEIGDGYRAKNSELGKTGLPFIRAGNLNNGFDTTGADLLRDESVAKAGGKVCRVGDVAFTSKGTIGRFARVTEHTTQFVYSPQVCYWRSLERSRLHPVILYCWMQSDDLGEQIAAVAGQTDMAPYVSLQDQRQMTMPVFPVPTPAVVVVHDV